MPRVVGVDIPSNKRLKISLRYLFGIGPQNALIVCQKADVDPELKASDVTEQQLSRIATVIERDYQVEGPLRRQIAQNIGRLKDIQCYRGMRHRRNLPVRGQRTKTNARTRKGPRKTVAGKKSVKEMRG